MKRVKRLYPLFDHVPVERFGMLAQCLLQPVRRPEVFPVVGGRGIPASGKHAEE